MFTHDLGRRVRVRLAAIGEHDVLADSQRRAIA
jgi:hypothetical protein